MEEELGATKQDKADLEKKLELKEIELVKIFFHCIKIENEKLFGQRKLSVLVHEQNEKKYVFKHPEKWEMVKTGLIKRGKQIREERRQKMASPISLAAVVKVDFTAMTLLTAKDLIRKSDDEWRCQFVRAGGVDSLAKSFLKLEDHDE